jgi:hypothetical protein
MLMGIAIAVKMEKPWTAETSRRPREICSSVWLILKSDGAGHEGSYEPMWTFCLYHCALNEKGTLK